MPTTAPKNTSRNPSHKRRTPAPKIEALPGVEAPAPAGDNYKQTVKRLAKLPTAEHELERKSEARRLDVRVTILDTDVKTARRASGEEAKKAARPASGGDKLQGQALEWREVEAWHKPVDGATLLDNIVIPLNYQVAERIHPT